MHTFLSPRPLLSLTCATLLGGTLVTAKARTPMGLGSQYVCQASTPPVQYQSVVSFDWVNEKWTGNDQPQPLGQEQYKAWVPLLLV